MNYPPIPPSKSTPSPPRRRPTYGEYHADQYNDDYNNNNKTYSAGPRRKPVGRTATADNYGSRTHGRSDSYGAPPVVASRQNTVPSTYQWPQAAQQAASGYNEPKSILVYPEEFVFEQPPPPPLPPPTNRQATLSYYDGPERNKADIYFGDDEIPEEINDIYRPLPAP